MNITDEKLSVFKTENELKQYLRVNGYRDSELEKVLERWRNPTTNEKVVNQVYNTAYDSDNETTKSENNI